MIASRDHVKGKSLEVLAVKNPEVRTFTRRYGLMSVVKKRKCFKKGKYIGYHKNPKRTRKPQK